MLKHRSDCDIGGRVRKDGHKVALAADNPPIAASISAIDVRAIGASTP